MKTDPNEWIDPAIARRLMLEYQNAIGIKGASEIERRIDTYTKLGLHRKTIENWLRDPDSTASPQTLKIVLRFLRTAHFQQIVPRTRDYLDSDARLSRIGAALFDLYGVVDEDLPTTIEKNAHIAGWWKNNVFLRGSSKEPNYLYIAPVSNRPFSKIHLMLHSDDVPMGSGLTFPRDRWKSHSARIWPKVGRYREKVMTLRPFFPAGINIEHLSLTFEPTRQVPFPAIMVITVMFQRITESEVPEQVQAMFDQWSRDVLPRGMGGDSIVS
ncbi:hypothetical protein QOZ23_04665 [Pseudomonas aeruginosa]|uniref:hypothetical protein n=1 Tax=Pseudomonas aeruginosa TaxID=287 RepID=UPI003458D167